jgi:hypothetical protein
MSETESSPVPVSQGGAIALRDEYQPEFDVSAVLAWLREHYVLVGGLLLILAEIIWKGLFLSRMYFSQDDYVNLDIALKSPFDWRYLSLIGAGHLYPGLRAVTWVLARISLYNWGLDSGLALVLVAASSLAALRLLRLLFGDRPGILIPLTIYLLTPLTVPDLGWWWCAMESLPFQLAIFMSLAAHVQYVRTNRWRHLAVALAWLVVGLLFFEKAIVLAPLLFAVTAGFLMGTGSWAAGALSTLRRHWRAWTCYGVVMAAYAVMFFLAFGASGQQAQAPSSGSATWEFAWTMVKDTLIPGALGGPWRWLPLADLQYALAAPPTAVIWFAGLVAVVVVLVSVGLRFVAWRAWAILVGWVVCADMLPVILGRLYAGLQGVLGLETRYLADAACVLAICLGLALFRVTSTPSAQAADDAASQDQARHASSSRRAGLSTESQLNLRYAAAALVAVFVVSSIWSVHSYEVSTPGGSTARSYIANARQAVTLAPRGTNVLDQYMPQNLVEGLFGQRYALESTVIGDLAQGRLAGKFRWIVKPEGTIDGLRVFGSDGKLYPAAIAGVYSVSRPEAGFGACWPEHKGKVVVQLHGTTSVYDWELHFGYIWGSPAATAIVWYGGVPHSLTVLPGIHNAYLSVSGQVTNFTVTGLGPSRICVAGAQSGQLVPLGTPIP